MPVLEHAQSIVLEFDQQVLHKQHLHQNPYGAVAQLGERVVRNDEVGSSILLGSTILQFPAPVAQLDRASAS